jgi:hypothetical protein
MHVNLGIWDKLSKLMVFLLFIAGILGVSVWYFPLIKQKRADATASCCNSI